MYKTIKYFCQDPFLGKNNFLLFFYFLSFPLARQFKHPGEFKTHLLLIVGSLFLFFFRDIIKKIPFQFIFILFGTLIFFGYLKHLSFVGFDEEWLIENGNLWRELGFTSFFKIYTSLPWSGGQHPPGSMFFTYLLSGLGLWAQKFVSILFFILTIPALKILSNHITTFRVGLVLLISNILFSRLLFGINNDILLFFSFSWFLVFALKKPNFVIAGIFLGISIWFKYFALIYFFMIATTLTIKNLNNFKFYFKVLIVASLCFLPWIYLLVDYGIWYSQFQNIIMHAIHNPELASSLSQGRTRLFFYLPDNIFSIGPVIFLIYISFISEIYKNNKALGWFLLGSILFFIFIQPTNRYFIPLYSTILFLGKDSEEEANISLDVIKLVWPVQFLILLFYMVRGFS